MYKTWFEYKNMEATTKMQAPNFGFGKQLILRETVRPPKKLF